MAGLIVRRHHEKEKMDEYTLVERSPGVEEYQRLRAAVGWTRMDVRAMEISLRNALFSVCAVTKGEVIGCGRVVGDGGIYFYIQDIMVLPEFQRKGIGKRIMGAVMDYLKDHAHPNAFVGLMAAKGVSTFYERYGFTERPPDAPGMFLYWDSEKQHDDS
jgi:GNAT superfamily N-acetyltransferase